MSTRVVNLDPAIAITHYEVFDIRFPTSLNADGSDAMNKDADYSGAFVKLYTSSSDHEGIGMTFTTGRGNDIVCETIRQMSKPLVGQSIDQLFSNMGKTYSQVTGDAQFRWLGPETGVVALAAGAIINALWDMFARAAQKPLWQLLADMTPEQVVACIPFRYITDAITPEEALELLKEKSKGKQQRIEEMKEQGYPAYTTSAGWLGYDSDKIARLVKEAIAQGFNHVKMKVGGDLEDDKRRLALVRSIIDDEDICRTRSAPDPKTLTGKNAGPTGSILMIDANQVWSVPEAISWCKELAQFKPWFIEEPTAPTDALGHAAIRRALKGQMGVATGEHCPNRMIFKQLLQSEAIDVCQIDSCRVAGVNENLAILLMAAKFGIPVCPHSGGVGLCEMTVHLSLIDYFVFSANCDVNVLEFVDQQHEHFIYPTSLNENGRYRVPLNPKEGYSVQMKPESIDTYTYPTGSYWQTRLQSKTA